MIDYPEWIRSVKGLLSLKEVIKYREIATNRTKFRAAKGMFIALGELMFRLLWNVPMNEAKIIIITGICNTVLNRYKLKFTKGTILFRMELSFLSLASCTIINPMMMSTKAMMKKTTALMPTAMFGLFSMR
jgi:hypothetical protein